MWSQNKRQNCKNWLSLKMPILASYRRLTFMICFIFINMSFILIGNCHSHHSSQILPFQYTDTITENDKCSKYRNIADHDVAHPRWCIYASTIPPMFQMLRENSRRERRKIVRTRGWRCLLWGRQFYIWWRTPPEKYQQYGWLNRTCITVPKIHMPMCVGEIS